MEDGGYECAFFHDGAWSQQVNTAGEQDNAVSIANSVASKEATGHWMGGLCRNKNADGDWDSSIYGAYCHAPSGQTPETCKALCLGYPSCVAAGGYAASCDLFTAQTTGTPTDCPDGTTATAASGTSPDPSVYIGKEYLTYTSPSSRCFIKASTA